jgi:tetratricopeptide (TPR) repeat protein
MRTALFGIVVAVMAGWMATATGCKMAADGQNVQGVALYQQGQYQAAMQEFQKALANDPKNADAYYNLAATTHRMGVQKSDQQMLAQAETLYNQCLDLNANHNECYRGLAVLLGDTGRQDRAFSLIKNWAAANPTSSDARIELARLYEETNDLNSAQVHLNAAIMADQNNARAWAALGRLRERTGDSQQALANYQRSLSLNGAQAAIADRVAALSRSLQGTTEGTRTVTTPTAPLR